MVAGWELVVGPVRAIADGVLIPASNFVFEQLEDSPLHRIVNALTKQFVPELSTLHQVRVSEISAALHENMLGQAPPTKQSIEHFIHVLRALRSTPK
jgi:hypothetical protein